MGVPSDMTERHSRVLAELSELGLTLARDLHARAIAAETPDEATSLAMAFHRISRSVRQSLALEARLERDRHVEPRRPGDGPAPGEPLRKARRKQALREALEPLIWQEREGEERDYLLDLLEDRLEHTGYRPGFADQPLEDHIADLRADFGLSLPDEYRGSG